MSRVDRACNSSNPQSNNNRYRTQSEQLSCWCIWNQQDRACTAQHHPPRRKSPWHKRWAAAMDRGMRNRADTKYNSSNPLMNRYHSRTLQAVTIQRWSGSGSRQGRLCMRRCLYWLNSNSRPDTRPDRASGQSTDSSLDSRCSTFEHCLGSYPEHHKAISAKQMK